MVRRVYAIRAEHGGRHRAAGARESELTTA